MNKRPLYIVSIIMLLAIVISAVFYRFVYLEVECPLGDGVSQGRTAEHLIICNSHYIAKINRNNGQLDAVFDRGSNGEETSLAISSDWIEIRTSDMSQSISTSDLTGAFISVEDAYDFYTKVTTAVRLGDNSTDPSIVRTYEFTKGRYIYEQVAFYPEVKLYGSTVLEEFRWRIDGRYGVKPHSPIDDLWTLGVPPEFQDDMAGTPWGPLGGLGTATENTVYDMVRFNTYFAQYPSPSVRTIVQNGRFHGTNVEAKIRSFSVYLTSTVIYIPATAEVHAWSCLPDRVAQFYPNFGLITKGRFINWNEYDQTNTLIPHIDDESTCARAYKDQLIRISMHLRARMEQDQWWPKWAAWSGGCDYPNGDIFTAHSRSFPQMAYTWALLTMKRKGNEWVHEPGDADVLYETLQNLYKHYEPSGETPHFEDIIGGEETPYISYSAHRKERYNDEGCRGVLNTHADALHFAWIMREVSQMYGDNVMEAKWRAVVRKYHDGSKALFERLYDVEDWGRLRYSISQTNPNLHYSIVSFRGIAAGYLQQGEYEVDFVEAVEKASQDSNEMNMPFVARLARVFPVALTFVGDELCMSHSVQAAGIREVLMFGEILREQGLSPYQRPCGDQRFAFIAAHRPHDQYKFIVEGGDRQWILTNGDFKSDWVPGFWEEMNPEDVDDRWRFNVRFNVVDPEPPDLRWTVSRKGDRLFIMTNFDAFPPLVGSLTFPVRHLKYSVTYRIWSNHQWGPAISFPSDELRREADEPPGIEVLFFLHKKDLVIIEVESEDWDPYGVKMSPRGLFEVFKDFFEKIKIGQWFCPILSDFCSKEATDPYDVP